MAVGRGKDGEPLDSLCCVKRMAHLNKDYFKNDGQKIGALPAAFDVEEENFRLSTTDEKSKPPHLSVFEHSLTTDLQAFRLTGEKKHLVLPLYAGEVRELICDSTKKTELNVQWFTAFVNDRDRGLIIDERPGANGHAGITGLEKAKPIRKFCRLKLAEMAAKNGPRLIDDRDI